MRKKKWFWFLVSLTDGEERAWVMEMSLEIMAVLQGSPLETWDVTHTDEGEDPQKANWQQAAAKAKAHRK